MSGRKPTGFQRMPVFGRQPQPNPERGLVLRILDARALEDREQALARARREMPWGARIHGKLVRSSPDHWSCLVRETTGERRVRDRLLAARRAGGRP